MIPPSLSRVSDLIDAQIGLTRGAVLYRGASGWAILAPGTVGYPLSSGGAGADPSYTSPSSLLDLIGSTRGSILYRGAGGWAILAPGTSTHVLTSNGAGADPSYQAGGGGGAETSKALATASATATVANTTTETTVLPSVSGSVAIGAGTAVQFEVYRLTFRGYYSSNGSGGLNLKLYLGSTVIGQTTSIFAGTATNNAWEFICDIAVFTTGATGTVWCFGGAFTFTSTSAGTPRQVGGTTVNSTTTIDFTATQSFDFKATWASASASNTITCAGFTLERLKT